MPFCNLFMGRPSYLDVFKVICELAGVCDIVCCCSDVRGFWTDTRNRSLWSVQDIGQVTTVFTSRAVIFIIYFVNYLPVFKNLRHFMLKFCTAVFDNLPMKVYSLHETLSFMSCKPFRFVWGEGCDFKAVKGWIIFSDKNWLRCESEMYSLVFFEIDFTKLTIIIRFCGHSLL